MGVDRKHAAAAAEAQREYCRREGFPLFAPYDGICWRCGRDIYERVGVKGAGRELATYCPHCHVSFVE